MNENINLCDILKNCPKGTKLFSYIHGEVEFLKIDKDESRYKIVVIGKTKEGTEYTETFTAEGILNHRFNGICTLVPSKDQPDWSKFTAPWYNKEESIKPKFKVGDIIRHKETNKNDVYKISKVYNDSYGIAGFNWGIYMKYQDQYELVSNKFDPKTLKACDRVIVKNIQNNIWHIQYFSHIEEEHTQYPFFCLCDSYTYCIPYNDETKHLVGTRDKAPKHYEYWED